MSSPADAEPRRPNLVRPQPTLFGLAAGLDFATLAATLVVVGMGVWLILATQPRVWVDLLADDAYYYLGVARGIVERGASSFAPPFETNGYQPLWLVLLTLSAAIGGTSATAMALQAYAWCCLFLLAFAYVARRTYGAAFPALMTGVAFVPVMLSGMETAMLPVFFILFMQAKDWRARGALGLALALTRLDALALVALRDAHAFATQRRFDPRPWIILAPTALIYAGVNLWLFGTPLPVSGLAKAIGNAAGENLWETVLAYGALMRGAAALALVLVALMLVTRTPPSALKHGSALMVLAGAIVVLALYYGVASGWPIWGWYSWPVMLLKFYLFQEIWDQAKALPAAVGIKRRLAAMALAVLAAAISASGILQLGRANSALIAAAAKAGVLPATYGRVSLDMIGWTEANLPTGSLIAMGDRAGSFGFFLGSGYGLLQTEGLVAPAAYLDAMRRNQGADFARAQGVRYWVADRARYLETDETIGLIEPIQSLSARAGPFLVCFARSALIYDRGYIANGSAQRRIVLDAAGERPCPAAFEEFFRTLRDSYSGLHRFSGGQLAAPDMDPR